MHGVGWLVLYHKIRRVGVQFHVVIVVLIVIVILGRIVLLIKMGLLGIGRTVEVFKKWILVNGIVR